MEIICERSQLGHPLPPPSVQPKPNPADYIKPSPLHLPQAIFQTHRKQSHACNSLAASAFEPQKFVRGMTGAN